MYRTLSPIDSKKFSLSYVLKILSRISTFALIGLYAVALIPQFFRYKDMLLEKSFILVVCCIVLYLLSAVHYIFFRRNRKNFIGTLELQPDKIIVNHQEIRISEIQSLRFVGNDIKGQFRGFLSNGTKNDLVIVLKNNQEVTTAFEQTIDNKLMNQKDILKIYQEQQILSLANYQNILNNTNYY